MKIVSILTKTTTTSTKSTTATTTMLLLSFLLLFSSIVFVAANAGNKNGFPSLLSHDDVENMNDYDRMMMTPRYSTLIFSNEHRSLQTKPTTCYNVGAKFQCEIFTTLSESNSTNNDNITQTGAYTNLTITTLCDLNDDIGFDFRKADNCNCEVLVSRSLANGTALQPKYCPCLICSEGFGNNPVSIDCSGWDNYIPSPSTNTTINTTDTNTSSPITDTKQGNSTTTTNSSTSVDGNTTSESYIDSIIINSCSSLDCGLACNGTCRIDCATSDQACSFCSNNPNNTEPPAVASSPSSGSGGGGTARAPTLTNFAPTSTSSATSTISTIFWSTTMIITITLFVTMMHN